MSQETQEWLNFYTLQSRAVWHTDEQLQKIANTIYNGPIPLEDVRSRLFGWEPLRGDLTSTATILTADGVDTVTMTDENRITIMRPPYALSDDDAGAILGVFKSGYKAHPYAKWLLENVSHILDDTLGIYSAGLLKGGAQAWVQVTVPDWIKTPSGVLFKPNLLCVTSFDGSIATTYKRTISNAVCDNTMRAALGEAGKAYKVKHSRYSDLKIMEAREALDIVHATATDFEAEVEQLNATTVTDSQWDEFLSSLVPTKDKDGKDLSKRSTTIATNKQAELNLLWNHDQRVAPWKNTAWGVVQAVNTHAHHFQSVRGMSRDERNMTNTIEGKFDNLDTNTMATLEAVLAA
jgi:phage/plasmid-like protein (TIGR03299 family)